MNGSDKKFKYFIQTVKTIRAEKIISKYITNNSIYIWSLLFFSFILKQLYDVRLYRKDLRYAYWYAYCRKKKQIATKK